MTRVLAVLIMTVALVGCKKADITPLEESPVRGVELEADASTSTRASGNSLNGNWERVAIQWLYNGPDGKVVGPKKFQCDLPYTEKWVFDGRYLSTFHDNNGPWKLSREGIMEPGNQADVFFMTNEGLPIAQGFMDSKFVVLENDGVNLKIKMIRDIPNKSRAKIWFKRIN